MARIQILVSLSMILWSFNVIDCSSKKLVEDVENYGIEILHSENGYRDDNAPFALRSSFGHSVDAVVGSSGSASSASEHYTIDNKAQPKKSCEYVYRSGRPVSCDYYIRFGNPDEANKQIFEKVYQKPETKQNPIEFVVEYQAEEGTTIGYILVEDIKRSVYILLDDLFVEEGGVGRGYLKLKIRSDHTITDGYRIVIYDK